MENIIPLLIKSLAYLDRNDKQHRTQNDHLTMLLIDADKAISNTKDRHVIQDKLFELLAIDHYFDLNPAEAGDFLIRA